MSTNAPVRPDDWPSSAELVDGLDLADLLSRLTDQVSPDAVLAHLQTMLVRQRQHVLRKIGLTAASSVNRGMAAQLLARIRAEGPGDRSGILHALVFPILNSFDLPLSGKTWTSIVSGDISPLVRTYIAHPFEARMLHFPSTLLPQVLQPLGLLACVIDQVPADAVALAFLANQDEQAAAHLKRLRETWPGLPTVHPGFTVSGLSLMGRLAETHLEEQDKPVTVDELERLIERLEDMSDPELDRWIARLHDPDLPEEPDDADQEQPNDALTPPLRSGSPVDADSRSAGAASPEGQQPPRRQQGDRNPESLLVELDRFNRSGFDTCLDTARTIVSELDAGQLPDPLHVERLLDQVREGLRLAEELRIVLSRPVAPSREALGAAQTSLRQRLADMDTTWLSQLSRMVTPEAVEQDAEAARVLARRLLERDETISLDDSGSDAGGQTTLNGLRALHTLIMLTTSDLISGAQPDYTAVAAAGDAVRDALPELNALMYAASGGAVTLPAARELERDTLAPPAPDGAASPGSGSDTVSSVAGQTVTDEPGPDQADPEGAAVGLVRDQPATPQDASAAEDRDGAPDAGHAGPGDLPTEQARDGEPPAITAVEDARVEPKGSVRLTEGDEAATDGSASEAVEDVTDVEGHVATADQDDDEDDEDFSGLDALLAGGAAERLSVLTGARRPAAPTQPTQGHGRTNSADDRETTGGQPGGTLSSEAEGLDLKPDEEVAAEVRAEAVTSVLPALLDAERYGLAADLLEASGTAPVNVTARRLGALATGLRLPTGPLASAFANGATRISREALGDDRAGQLLAWASACRIAVLAPSAGPATLLLELAPCVADSPALTDFGQALIDASRQGIVVVPEATGALGTIAAIEQSSDDLASEAGRLLRAALTKMFMYVPANGVYQDWMHPTGPIGEILTLVEANDPAAAADVSALILARRGRAERSMDEIFGRQRNGQKQHAKITGTPRQGLISRWEDALNLAGRWVEQADRLADAHTRMQGVSWQAAPLARLRQHLAQARDQALADLDAQRSDDSELNAALEAVASLLEETVGICTSGAPEGAETDLAYALHHEMLATTLPLSARTLLPHGGLDETHLDELLGLALGPAPEPTEVYEIRAARGDHDLTAVLVAGLASEEGELAQVLERRRAKDVAERAADTTERVAALASKIDTNRMSSALTDQAWSALAARAHALDAPSRSDFGRIAAEVSAIDDELGEQRAGVIAETVKRIRTRALDNPAVAENADRLVALAEQGDIASAEEYLEQALTGGQLPLSAPGSDHFKQFFPTVPALLGDHSDLLAQFRVTLSADAAPGSEVLPPAVQALCHAAGVDLSRMSDARRKAGTRALGSWESLRNQAQGRKLDLKSALSGVLSQTGLEFDEYKLEPGSPTGRTWLELTGVRGTGDASTPAFGSGMSPDGSTLRVLLVRTAPTPATVVEWMRNEANDRTVLVLWLGAPLSPDDRRTIADAARGHSRPPVLLLDAAALAYLVCQAEPRRATFEATALPFTADSPFRDTAGDTSPEMFYGRTEELDAVLDLNGPSIVYGGRQLGKAGLPKITGTRQLDRQHPCRSAGCEVA